MDWQMIGTVLFALVVGGVAAKAIAKVFALGAAVHDLVDYVKLALLDKTISDEERIGISNKIVRVEAEAKDALELAKQVAAIIAAKGK